MPPGTPREELIATARACGDLETDNGYCELWDEADSGIEGMDEIRSRVGSLCSRIEEQVPEAAKLEPSEIVFSNRSEPMFAQMSCFAYSSEGTSFVEILVTTGGGRFSETCEQAAPRDEDVCERYPDGSLRVTTPAHIHGAAQLLIVHANGTAAAEVSLDAVGDAQTAEVSANSLTSAALQVFSIETP